MIDLETRLGAALRDVVHPHGAPPGITQVAARRATRIRRRRRAAGGMFAVVAAVSAGVWVTGTSDEPARERLTPLATPSSVPSPPKLSTDDPIRVVYSRHCDQELDTGAPFDCVRISLETTAGEGQEHYDLTDRRAPATDQPEPQPRTLLVKYSDGTTREVPARRLDAETWSFDIPPRSGGRVVRLDIRTDDGRVQTLTFVG